MPNPATATLVLNQTEDLKELKRKLHQTRLRSDQTPADRSAILAQKRAVIDHAEVKDDIVLAGTLAKIASEIGLNTCHLSTVQLRGALLMVKDKAGDQEALVTWSKRDDDFQKSKRRVLPGLRAFVAAAAPGAELVEAARRLGLRQDLLAGGFKGSVEPHALVALGTKFKCSIRVLINKEMRDLVIAGEVEDKLLETLDPIGSEVSSLGEAGKPAAIGDGNEDALADAKGSEAPGTLEVTSNEPVSRHAGGPRRLGMAGLPGQTSTK